MAEDPRRSAFNPPRMINIPAYPIVANMELFLVVCAFLGGVNRLLDLTKAFAAKRYAETGWRVVKDITSRDSKRASGVKGVPATELLTVPFQSLTATMAAIVLDRSTKAGTPLKLSREQSLSVYAALRDDAKTLETAQVRIWDEYNKPIGYFTLGLSALPAGQIPEDAIRQAAELEF